MKNHKKVGNNGTIGPKSSLKLVRGIRISGTRDRKIMIRIKRIANYQMLGGPGYSMI